MWSIGVKSGLITVLSLLIFELTVAALHLPPGLQTIARYAVFALGIYSAHYYYKNAAQQPGLTYTQGVRLGAIVSMTTGLISGSCMYIVAIRTPHFTDHVVHACQNMLQARGISESSAAEIAAQIQASATPAVMALAQSTASFLTGLLLTLLVSLRSKAECRPERK